MPLCNLAPTDCFFSIFQPAECTGFCLLHMDNKREVAFVTTCDNVVTRCYKSQNRAAHPSVGRGIIEWLLADLRSCLCSCLFTSSSHSARAVSSHPHMSL